MNELIMLGLGLLAFGWGLRKISKYLEPREDGPVKANCHSGHSWEEHETFKGSNLFFLKCNVCKKTLKELMED